MSEITPLVLQGQKASKLPRKDESEWHLQPLTLREAGGPPLLLLPEHLWTSAAYCGLVRRVLCSEASS